MPKTGSSAIQAFLGLNPEYLLINGLSYPGHKGFDQAFQTSSGNVSQLQDWIPNNNKKAIKKLINSALTKKVILSSEILYLILKKDPEHFAEYFSNYNFKIICYVRRIDEFTESCLNQLIKNHGMVNKNNYMQVANSHEYFSCLNKAVKFISKDKLIIRVYDKSNFQGGNIYSDFMSIFGKKINNYISYPSKQVNPSLNSSALEFRRLLNEFNFDKENMELKYKVNSLLASYTVNSDVDNNSLLSTLQKQKLLEIFDQRINQFNSEYLNNGQNINYQLSNSSEPKTYSKNQLKQISEYIKSHDNELYLLIQDHVCDSSKENILSAII